MRFHQLASFLITFLLGVAANGSNRNVVVMGFMGWDMAPQNISSEIADYISQNPKLIGQNVNVTSCKLPVVFGKAFLTARDCISKLSNKPDLIILMGIGGSRLGVELEAGAFNYKKLNPDTHDSSQILNGGTPLLPFRLPLELMACDLPKKEQKYVLLSNGIGSFVCNETSYLLENWLRQENIPFGFFHIVHQSVIYNVSGKTETIKLSVKYLSRIVSRLIESALSENKFSSEMPMTLSQIQEAKKSSSTKCEKSSLETLYTETLLQIQSDSEGVLSSALGR